MKALGLLNRLFSLVIIALIAILAVILVMTMSAQPLSQEKSQEILEQDKAQVIKSIENKPLISLSPEEAAALQSAAKDMVIPTLSAAGLPQTSRLSDVLPPTQAASAQTSTPDQIPAFQIDGLGSADLSDEVMILNFFATWCPSCVKENALLMDLQKTYGIPVYGINIYETAKAHKAFFKEHPNPFKKIGVDEFSLVTGALGISSVPVSMVITKDLTIHWRHNDEIDAQMIQEQILPVIARLNGLPEK